MSDQLVFLDEPSEGLGVDYTKRFDRWPHFFLRSIDYVFQIFTLMANARFYAAISRNPLKDLGVDSTKEIVDKYITKEDDDNRYEFHKSFLL